MTKIYIRKSTHKTDRRTSNRHLLTATKRLLDRGGIQRPWYAIGELLRHHQLVKLALPLSGGKTVRIEREARPADAEQKAVYGVLGVDS